MDFLDWKNAILNYAENNDKGIVLKLKDKMNTKRSFDDRWHYLDEINIKLEPEWVQAFIDGEGSFQCGIGYHKNRDKTILKVTNSLEVAQHTHDVKLLVAIMEFFGQGFIKPKFDTTSLKESKSVRGVSRFITYGNDSITSFFDKYPMYTSKQLDYLDWKQLIDLKNKNSHKEDEGLKSMIDLKKGMNRGRLFNENVISRSDILKVIKS